jgi:multidrug resistance efflux pump
MWQKKSTPEIEQPALALRPAGARPAAEVSSYGSFDMEGQKEIAVNTQPRSHRFLWFLGILLLAGTALGAAWALNHGSTDKGAAPVESAPPPPGVVALGMVDSDPEIRKLRPPVAGKITEVAPEGKLLKKGDRILRLDNRTAALLLDQAEAALGDARLRLDLAKIMPDKHKLELKNQEKAIIIAQKKTDALVKELEATRDMHKDKLVSRRVLDAAEYNLEALEALVDVQKNKLALLKLAKPELEVARAEREVAAKEAQRNNAKLALDNCDLLADEPGTVLRAFFHPGEWIGPDSKIPAVQFCPAGKRIIRAEVLQEWAGLVEKGQKVVIEDDAHAGPRWNGTVTQVSDWITQKRDVMLEPFMVNDVRTLECLIDVAPGGPPLRIGQRVRVTIQPGK